MRRKYESHLREICGGFLRTQSEVKQVPMKPAKPCKHPSCPNLTHDYYCDDHKSLYVRESGSKRGYNYKWQKLRKQFLKRHPLCEACKQNGKYVTATVVDHIIPHRGNENLMWDEGNWQSLCKRCHDKKTGTHDSTPTYSY